jgi:hypothetical protein
LEADSRHTPAEGVGGAGDQAWDDSVVNARIVVRQW